MQRAQLFRATINSRQLRVVNYSRSSISAKADHGAHDDHAHHEHKVCCSNLSIF